MDSEREREGLGELEIPAPEEVFLPFWKEAGVPLEWLRFRRSSVYQAEGLPRGDGAPVLLVPGLLCSDLHFLELARWLRRLGYRPYFSGIYLNSGCLEQLGEPLVVRLERIHARTGRRVHLVGHSLGGVLARSIAALRPEMVASVLTLGSPLRSVRSHPVVVRAARLMSSVRQALPAARPGCMTSACSCPFVQAYHHYPEEIPFTSVFSREDGVVDWQSCALGVEGRDVEVSGTHLGLFCNAEACRAIAEHLKEAHQRSRKEE